jgi:hypothetical protein
MKGLRQSSSFSDMSTSQGGAEFWSFEGGSGLSGSKSLICNIPDVYCSYDIT